MSILEANFQTLRAQYFELTPAREAAGHLLSEIRARRFDELAELLRDYRVKPICNPKEVDRRAAVDSLLVCYSVMEIAILAGFISSPDGSAFWTDAKTILDSPEVRRYYVEFYPIRLPQLLWLRLRGVHERRDEHPSLLVTSLFQFIELDRRFLETLDDGYLLRMLDSFTIGGQRFEDLVELIRSPSAVVNHLLTVPEERDVLGRALYEFGEFLRFCFDLDQLLDQLRDRELLQSEIWCHYSYWFDILGERTNKRLGLVLEQFLEWKPDDDDPEAAKQILLYVEHAMDVLKKLTSKGYPAPVDALLRQAREQEMLPRSVALSTVLANIGVESTSDELLSYLITRLPEAQVYSFQPPEGTMIMAAFDWKLVLGAGVKVSTVVSAIWGAYEKFVKPLREQGRSEAGLYVQVELQPGRYVQVMVGWEVEDETIFCSYFVDRIIQLVQFQVDDSAGTANAMERSDDWVRRK